MSLVLSLALAVTGPVLSQCSWDRPGANPFQGDVVAAVDRYQDIPAEVRAELKRRIAARNYDEMAEITRDAVKGETGEYHSLRDMHFGSGTICRTVTRQRWQANTVERGLVYCEQGHCIIIPTVCRNVSRVTRAPNRKAAAAPVAGQPTAGAAQTAPAMQATAMVEPPAQEAALPFDAPSAGVGQPLASVVPAVDGDNLNTALAAASGPSFQSLASGLPVPAAPGFPSGVLPLLAAAAPVALGAPPLPVVVPVVTQVPEPSAYALAAVGVAALAWVRRRRMVAKPSAA